MQTHERRTAATDQRRASTLIDIADGIHAARALVHGAAIVASQIEGADADAVHEILQAVEDRLVGLVAYKGETAHVA